MTPINPIELEKSVERTEHRVLSFRPDEWPYWLVVDVSRIIAAAKERLQQLKEGNMSNHIHEWKPLSSDPECSDICVCGAEKSIRTGKIYEQIPKVLH